jgi:hypothetical protein
MQVDDIEVTLTPQVGTKQTRIGPIEIELGNWIIHANKIQVGYVGKHAGARVKIIHQTLPPEVVDFIKSKVDEMLGRSTPPAAILQAWREDDDEDEGDF